MNSSSLSFLIALGLPGSSACTAQQSGLPRLGQTPPAAEQPAQPSTAPAPLAKAQTVDADDDADEADADDEMDVDTDEPEEMAVEEVELPESAEAFVFGDIEAYPRPPSATQTPCHPPRRSLTPSRGARGTGRLRPCS